MKFWRGPDGAGWRLSDESRITARPEGVDRIRAIRSELPSEALPTIVETYFDAPSGSGVAGSLSVTFAPMTAAGAGSVAIQGALAATLDPMTLSGSGTVVVDGALASALAPMTLAASGLVEVRGSLSATLDAMTLAGTATVSSSAGTIRTYYRGRIAHAGAVPLSRTLYYVEE